jgi:hypothetical protein
MQTKGREQWNVIADCKLFNIFTCWCLRVTYKTGFGLDDWIYCTLYIRTFRDYRQLHRYRRSTHFPVHRYTHAHEKFFLQHCTGRFDVWEKMWRHTSKWRLFKRKQYAYVGFSKRSQLSKYNVVTELNMEEIHLQIMLLPSEIDIQWWSNVLHIREGKSLKPQNMGVRKPSRHSRNRKR